MAIITLPVPLIEKRFPSAGNSDTRSDTQAGKVISIEDRLGVVYLPNRRRTGSTPPPPPNPGAGDAA